MRTLFRTALMLAIPFFMQCSPAQKSTGMQPVALDLQGHRGARGLMPENTIPAMIRAIDLGVTTLEMDVVISKDGQVVVSHDAYFHENITTTPDGRTITKAEAAGLLLYQMPYDSIRKYDVGLKPHPGFPKQEKMAVHKPLLTALIDSCEQHAGQKGKTIRYNIEIKSKAGQDAVQHPAPPQFAELVVAVLRSKNILERTTIQSFDVRPLQYLHQHYPAITLSYLVENTTTSLDAQLQQLGFTPNIYSPNFAGVTKELVAQAHAKGMKVIPWTVNTLPQMQQLVDAGVDGMISDYPDLFSQLKHH